MVADALHDVAHHLRVEVPDRQAHEFGQEVGDQRDIYTRIDMQKYPTPNKDNPLASSYAQLGVWKYHTHLNPVVG